MKPALFDLSRKELFYLFLTFSGAYVLLTYFTNTYLLTDSFYMNLWSEDLSPDRIRQMIQTNEKIQIFVYIFTPVILFLKLLLITFSIQAGLYVSDIEISFKKVFQIVLVAEMVPLLNTLIRFIYFLFTGIDSFEQINSFAPLSVMSLLHVKDIPSYFAYPLQLINVFEVVYWLLLAIGLKVYLGKPFLKTFKLVASSYGVALLLWVLVVVFIQVQTG